VRRASFLVLAVLVAGGCGGGGGGGSGGGGGERLSRADYASKADAICRKSNKRTKSIGNVRNLSDLAKAFDRALPILESALAELRTLKPPEKEQHTVSLWLAQSQVLKRDLEQIRDRARAKDLKSVQSLFAKAQSDDQRGNELARKLGMKVCSKG
jgi:hypothetical protein